MEYLVESGLDRWPTVQQVVFVRVLLADKAEAGFGFLKFSRPCSCCPIDIFNCTGSFLGYWRPLSRVGEKPLEELARAGLNLKQFERQGLVAEVWRHPALQKIRENLQVALGGGQAALGVA
jgi:hypothetical protein